MCRLSVASASGREASRPNVCGMTTIFRPPFLAWRAANAFWIAAARMSAVLVGFFFCAWACLAAFPAALELAAGSARALASFSAESIGAASGIAAASAAAAPAPVKKDLLNLGSSGWPSSALSSRLSCAAVCASLSVRRPFLPADGRVAFSATLPPIFFRFLPRRSSIASSSSSPPRPLLSTSMSSSLAVRVAQSSSVLAFFCRRSRSSRRIASRTRSRACGISRVSTGNSGGMSRFRALCSAMKRPFSLGTTRQMATPSASARAVRPERCT
mmetsp:Transcript_22982/g.58940  ORF Transcript_22982/g.58940 Transcript_22982/m.58940 type:complete len:272 (+) Transcript_22982:66-881(+)